MNVAPHTHIIDVKPENRIKTVKKLADRGLAVEFHSDQRGIIGKDAPLVQAFAVYSIIAEL